MERKHYWGFTPEQKQYARDRANGRCEIFYPDCERPNTNRVNHLIGSLEGRLAGFPKSVIQDITQNSFLACEAHEALHDIQEQEHIEQIIFMRGRRSA